VLNTLTVAGYDATIVPDGDTALGWLGSNVPALIVLDLVMPGTDGYTVLRWVRSHPDQREVPVIVLTALESDEEIRRVFDEGADDYLRKPFRPIELIARLRGQLRIRDYVEQLSRRERNAQVVVELTQLLASSLEIRQVLRTVVTRIAAITSVDRCSIVLLDDSLELGRVVATSDDPTFWDCAIVLERYPELRQVVTTKTPLLVENVPQDPLFDGLAERTSIPWTAMALVPIIHEQRCHGVVFMRARKRIHFDDDDLSLVRAVANATAIALSNAHVLSTLRQESIVNTHAREEAEQRLQLFQRYADLFESAADGMMVIDRTGQVLFSNPRTREITGYSESELTGLRLDTLFGAQAQERTRRLLRGFQDGVYPRSVDLAAQTKEHQSIIVSVSFSRVLHESNAVLLSLRDVTIERQTAVELKQTKEFLERVIDASLDAIVSTAMDGRVVLFNRAAARILGFDSTYVMTHLNAESLYPPGVARYILRRLADPAEGGFGRLDGCRTTVVSRSGEQIPVSLSAAFIFENDAPIGIVGLFTDLREQLRIEEDLQRAQTKLRAQERDTAIAELAGAAAHELSQPLTSVIGYAELLRRSLPAQAGLSHATAAIIGEAERMAEIVRRIGTITRYETKDYVGEAKILDLARSSPESGSWDEGS
jgi:PAS domain S-box-containing protein